MKMSAAESLALETILTFWEYEESFDHNISLLLTNQDAIGIKESYEDIDPEYLADDIVWLADCIQKLIYKELEKVKLNDTGRSA